MPMRDDMIYNNCRRSMEIANYDSKVIFCPWGSWLLKEMMKNQWRICLHWTLFLESCLSQRLCHDVRARFTRPILCI